MSLLFDFASDLPELKSGKAFEVMVKHLLDIDSPDIDSANVEKVKELIAKLKSYKATLQSSDAIDTIKENGLSVETVQTFITLLDELEVKVSDETRKVIDTLSMKVTDFDEGVTIPLVGLEPKIPAGNLTKIAVKGEFEANATLHVRYVDSVPEFDNDQIQGCMEYGLTGNIGASADLSFSATSGAAALSFGAGGSASAKGDIRIYSSSDSEALLLKALYKDLRALDDIPDLSAFVSQDVDGLTLSYSGQLNAYANVALGYIWTANQGSQSAEGKKNLSVKLGGSASTEWAVAGEFSLVSYRNAGNQLVVEINKKKSTSKTTQLALSATIATPGIKDKAKGYVQELMELDGQLKDFLDKYSSPKDILKGKLASKIEGRPDWQQSLIKLSTGEDTSQELIDSLTDKIATKLDKPFTKFDEWIDDNTQIDDMAKKVAQALGLDDEVEKLEAFRDMIQLTAEEWHSGFKEDLVKLATDNAGSALDPIKKLGLRVDERLNQLDELTAELLAPIHNFRKRYLVRLNQITEFINTTMVEEIGIQYQRISTQSGEEQALFKAAFTIEGQPNLDEVAALYANCMSGNLKPLLEKFRNGTNAGLFELLDCQFKFVISAELKSSFSINLFGLDSMSSTIMSEEAVLVRDGHGQLSAFSSEAEYQAVVKSGNEFNRLTIANSFNYLDSDENTLSINLMYGDEDLETDELVGYLQIFENMQLLPAGIADKSQAALEEKGLIDTAKDKQMLVQLSLPLSKQQLSVAYSETDEKISDDVILYYAVATQKYNKLERGNRKTIEKIIRAAIPGISFSDAVFKLLKETPNRRKVIGDTIFALRYESRRGKRIGNQVLSFLNDIDQAAQAMVNYLALVETMCEFEAPATLDDDAAETLKKLKAKQIRDINQQLDDLVENATNFFEINVERVHPKTVAFIKCMQTLSGMREESLVPMIYSQGEGELPEPIIVI